MRKKTQKRDFLVLFFIFLLGLVSLPIQADVFVGEIETGLIELKDFGYPVYLFVPPNVQPGRNYPLIISIPNQGESPEKNIELWTSVAKRQTMLVLAPAMERIEDVPFDFDRWFFQLKALVANQYPVNPKKIYLVGKENGATYAAYLGINYPEEFSAVGLLAGSWTGRFQKIMQFQTSPVRQLPFFVALKEDQTELFQQTEIEAAKLVEKGYPIKLVRFQKGEEFLSSEFKKEFLAWLEDQSEKWQAIAEKSQKTFKEKARRAIKNFFVV